MRERIAIVDDNAAVCEALAILLTAHGYHPVTCAHPSQLGDDADLVLLDMNFSRDTTSGEEGLAALSAINAPIICLTAWGTIDAAVKAMKLGARDYLTKPWDNVQLLDTLHRTLHPLRTRPEEIIPLAQSFLPKRRGFTPKALSKLKSFRGDEDELRACVDAAVAKHPGLVSAADLVFPEANNNLADLTHKAAEEALKLHDGNVSRAAKELGISRQALYRLTAKRK